MLDSFTTLAGKRKTHCKQGHAFDGTERFSTNWRGYSCRVCKECARLRMQRKRADPTFRERGNAAQRKYRLTHSAEYKAAYTKIHEKKRQILLDARAGGCVKCGEKHPACLDFHHREGKKDKLGNIGEIRNFAFPKLLAEIAKCDILCSNCHRIHHHDERQSKE